MKYSSLTPTQNPHTPTADSSVAPLTVNCPAPFCLRERSDPIRLAYVDDNSDDRELLKLMVSRLKGLRLVMCFATGEEALKSPAMMEVQVVLMDIRMQGMGGIACARLLKKALPSLTILMLTGMDDPALLWEAFIAGANGFLNKPLSETECWAAISLALAGGVPVVRSAIQGTISSAASGRAATHLSALQRAVLEGFAQGRANKEIAADLGVSVYAVENSARKIYAKLHVQNRAAAVSQLRPGTAHHSSVQG
jgi:DNA-binding NarL/FixJ family response regulator